MKYRVFADRVKLIDSYNVSKEKFSRELMRIKNIHPDCPLWQRSERSLLTEWASHNLAYLMGIRRDKTKDCDLNFTLAWYMKLVYSIVGTIALWLIK